MNYVEIINDALQYIESNLHRKLSLEELASRYYISPTYFYRIFRAVTNQTVKSYILERKLSAAALALRNTDRNVLDIAFRYGFNSHEQFTRDFLKMFHVTPSRYRKNNIPISLTDRIDIVERDFKNKKKEIIVDNTCHEIREIKLLGKEIIFNPWNSCELEEMMRKMIAFEEEYARGNRLYNIVCGNRRDLSRICCFYGIAEDDCFGDRAKLVERSIPASRYAIFTYPGSMVLVFPTVLKDMDKWLSVTELKKDYSAGIDMIELFPEDYKQTGNFYLYVPVLSSLL